MSEFEKVRPIAQACFAGVSWDAWYSEETHESEPDAFTYQPAYQRVEDAICAAILAERKRCAEVARRYDGYDAAHIAKAIEVPQC